MIDQSWNRASWHCERCPTQNTKHNPLQAAKLPCYPAHHHTIPTTKSHNAVKHLIPEDPPTVLFKPALSHKNGNQQLHFNSSKSSPWHWTQAGLIPAEAEAEEGSRLSHIPAPVTHLGRVTPQRGLSFSAPTLHRNKSLAH